MEPVPAPGLDTLFPTIGYYWWRGTRWEPKVQPFLCSGGLVYCQRKKSLLNCLAQRGSFSSFALRVPLQQIREGELLSVGDPEFVCTWVHHLLAMFHWTDNKPLRVFVLSFVKILIFIA